MAADSGRNPRHRRSAAPAAPVQPPSRLLAGFGGSVLVGAGLLGGVLAAPAGATLPAGVHRGDVALVDSWSPYINGLLGDAAALPAPAAYNFDDALHFVLDDLLKVGGKTIPELITGSDASLTMGALLGGLSSGGTALSTSLGIHETLNLLGLDNINVAQVMAALSMPVLDSSGNPTTFTDILDQLQLTDVRLDQLLTPLGIPHSQTLYGLVDRFSSLNETLGTLMSRIGPIGDAHTQSVQSALQSIGLGGFYDGWFTGAISLHAICSGVTGTVEDALHCIKTEYDNADSQHPNITLDSDQTAKYLLTHLYQLIPGTKSGDFDKPMGAFTIGEMLGFDEKTTIGQLVNGPTGFESDPNHVGVWVNTNVTIGQWQNGIVDGSPSGPSVVTNISGDPWWGYTYSAPWADHTQGTNHLPWYWHDSKTDPSVMSPNGTPVWVNPAPSDGGFGPHHPPENNIPVPGGGSFPPGYQFEQPLPETTQPLGSMAWGDVLSWLNLSPDKSIADVISDFWYHDVQLGFYKIGDALMGMVINPGPLGSGLTDSTPVTDFMDAIGWGNMTLDQFIGLN